MNTRNPLAAALLLIAASASAQPLAGGYNFGGGQPTTPFTFGAASGPVDDIVFKCGTVPYIACTDAHLKRREAIRASGTCPVPASAACVNFLMKEGGTAPVQLLGNQANPSTANDEFFKKCGTVPYRLCTPAEEAQKAKWEKDQSGVAAKSGLPYDQQPGFIGPPAPPKNQGPQPFADDKSFKQAMREQEDLTPGKVVDLGNKTYAVDTGNGKYSIGGLCSGAPCNGMPKPADQIPGLSDAIQAANSLNSGAGSINDGNKNAFRPNSTPTPPGGSGRSSQGTPPADEVASNPSDEAKASGGDAGSFFRSNGGGGAGAGGASGGYTATAANGKEEAIATQAAELDGVFTYIKTQQIKAAIDKTAGAVTTGGDGTFATPATTPDANAGDLQFKGTQSGANR